MFDGVQFGEDIVDVVKGYVDRAVSPLLKRIEELEAKLAETVSVDALISSAVARSFADMPAPQPVAALEPDMVAISTSIDKAVADRVAEIPRPQDGKSVTVDDVAPMIAAEVQRHVQQIEPPKDGIGLASALIDRHGALVITLTDGKALTLGPVVGADCDMAVVERMVREAVDAIPRPKDGKDGFNLEDFDITPLADGRTIEMSFTAGALKHTYELQFPVPIYRGVWRVDGEYVRGDMTTFGGSLWHADKDAPGKPGESDWTLAAKRGRNASEKTNL